MDNQTTDSSWLPYAEKAKLRMFVTRYTSELLKRAIDRGVLPDEPDPDGDIVAHYKEKLDAFMPSPSVILEGISILYTVDMVCANARMKQYFEKMQSVPDMDKQLTMCYAMLRVLNGITTPLNIPTVYMPGSGMYG